MSAGGPDSIPTSADRRSKRPTKRRLLSPTSDQAVSVEALFAKPEQPLHIPIAATPQARALPPPPEIVTNVQGSSAGAGSGEFHVYKAARRREYERLRRMDEEVRNEDADREFEQQKTERQKIDDEKTRKNREKREKMKVRKAKAKSGGGPQPKQSAKSTLPSQKDNKSSFSKRADIVDDTHEADNAPNDTPTTAESSGSARAEARDTKGASPAGTSTPDKAPITGLIIHDDD
ncbi:hypothetical protein Cpir12675_003264 [Ceratocystis pirilliformis]|uniref:PRKR-interacting protein 1 n=1 Tax=Ceratocystis pirilliformis TaxID=259994 RepID=A0ABR3Z568_9PEZI